MISLGQNLVQNGGFGAHISCPNNLGQLGKCAYWSALYGSPDYFHACGLPEVSVPANLFGVQNEALLDSGYVGVSTYTTLFVGGQESVKVDLNQTLVAGSKYRIRFKVSLADSVNYASCCIGAILDNSPPPAPPYTSNLSDAELVLDASSIDDEQWYQMDQVYTAEGGEDKLFLGNFRPDSESGGFYRGEITPGSATAYFYIDDVEVYEDETVSIDETEFTFSIYPNPATTNLTIESRAPLAQVWVRDLAGRVVLSYPERSRRVGNIDVSSLHSGIYLVEVLTQNGQRAVQKVVVE
jgi:hypothetical protein